MVQFSFIAECATIQVFEMCSCILSNSMELPMIRRITTGLVIATLAVAPTVAFAKMYKTEKTCVAHKMVWKDGKCVKA